VAKVRVLLISTYEQGHQPLHVASPAVALAARNHQVRALDLSVEHLDPDAVAWADRVAISVPMHTAMRLGIAAARLIRDQRAELPICFYGLYAPVSRDHTLAGVADRVIAGEYEPALLEWVDGGTATQVVYLGRGRFSPPARHLLPALDRYAHLAVDGEERLVGYTEASHGCSHRCRHCPIPVVYDGRIRIVGADVVLADIAQLVELGARHITFGDPDFLNGVHHSLRVVEAMHAQFPALTFDCTTKVSHILGHRDIWDRMAGAGCLFVVSAFETLNDAHLVLLDKGHTAAGAAEAIGVLRGQGIEPRPSFLPFLPVTALDDVRALVDFVVEHDLIGNVDPVQYTIRLLLPEGSLLLDRAELAPHIGPYDAEQLTYTWQAADPRVDDLQAELAALVGDAVAQDEPAGAVFLRIYRAVYEATGRDPARDPVPAGATEGRPRLTEPWFC
jgi:radical SAM superfamily enzyme YgiQ (UPF0313 family)